MGGPFTASFRGRLILSDKGLCLDSRGSLDLMVASNENTESKCNGHFSPHLQVPGDVKYFKISSLDFSSSLDGAM